MQELPHLGETQMQTEASASQQGQPQRAQPVSGGAAKVFVPGPLPAGPLPSRQSQNNRAQGPPSSQRPVAQAGGHNLSYSAASLSPGLGLAPQGLEVSASLNAGAGIEQADMNGSLDAGDMNFSGERRDFSQRLLQAAGVALPQKGGGSRMQQPSQLRYVEADGTREDPDGFVDPSSGQRHFAGGSRGGPAEQRGQFSNQQHPQESRSSPLDYAQATSGASGPPGYFSDQQFVSAPVLPPGLGH